MPETINRVRSTWPLYVLFVSVAGVIAAILGFSFLGESLAALGIPDPGVLTTAGLPFVRAAAWMMASLAVGSFMTAAFYISPLKMRTLSVDGAIATRTGTMAIICYALIAMAMIPLTLSDISGQPLSSALNFAALEVAISQVATAQAWLVAAIIAIFFALGSALRRTYLWQPLWLAGSFAMVLPLGLEGHSAAGGDHDYGTNSLLFHLFFAFMWVGGLLGLIAHGRRLGPDMTLAVRRYSKIALISIIVMAISGTINAAIRVLPVDLLTTTYGRVVLAKLVLTIALGMIGFIHRQKTIPRLVDKPIMFIRVAIVEVIIMAATIGVAVSMGRTPPPPPRYIDLSPMALEMGYSLSKAPTFWNVWTTWRFDIMFSTFGIVIAALYLWGLHQLKKSNKSWPWQRTLWFMLGSLSLAVGMSNGIGLYMPAMFSMHMVAHMMLSMVIPVFLVLGAPITLALETLQKGSEDNPGMYEWLEMLVNSKTLKLIMHPAFNTVQYLFVFYILYITPWYDVMVSEHAGHLLTNWVFLLSGYLYYWEMISSDPKPYHNTVIKRLAWLVFSMPVHLYFGVYLMQLSEVLAYDFYAQLDLPWHPDLMHDQNVGGGIAWASGSFPLVVVFGTLFIQWLREDRAQEAEYESRVESGDEDDWDEYNRMLALMNSGETTATSVYHEEGFDTRG
ncbi:cytochrome c oxidase assembly protein [Corynebacterium kutscheri]|nr:cytochrome c oxidase assembly protein [Corynebacterium kutscheri]